jgi:hypothetical protein
MLPEVNVAINEYDVNRFEEIMAEMKELRDEAERIARDAFGYDSSAFGRAEGYWGAHIACQIDNDHRWLSREMCTMADTLEELKGLLDDGEGDDEDEDLDADPDAGLEMVRPSEDEP